MPLIPVLRRLRQGFKFKASLGFILRLPSRNKTKKKGKEKENQEEEEGGGEVEGGGGRNYFPY